MLKRRHRKISSIEDDERIDQEIRRRLSAIAGIAEWLLGWAEDGLAKGEGYGNAVRGARWFLQEMEDKDPGQELNNKIKGLRYYLNHGIKQ